MKSFLSGICSCCLVALIVGGTGCSGSSDHDKQPEKPVVTDLDIQRPPSKTPADDTASSDDDTASSDSPAGEAGNDGSH